jgi:tetratricopeptide (TPR) repeat protein
LIASEPRHRARVIAFGLALLIAAPARAETPPANVEAKRAAQEHLDRGNELFTQDRFADALGEFEAAFALFPSPKLHLNLGQCERALGHDAAAAEHFRKFLEEAPDVSPALRAETERHLEEARRAAEASKPSPPPAPKLAAPPPVVAAPLIAPAAEERSASKPLVKRWWFWAGVGVLAAGAALSTYLIARAPDPACNLQHCY